jgi:hypothetical protein
MKDIQAGLHPDGLMVRIGIGDIEPDTETMKGKVKELASIDIDTAQLETFLLNLGATRKQMRPKVPDRLEPGRPIFKDSSFHPKVMVGQTQLVEGKGIYMALRHAGYGWLAFALNTKEAAEIVQLLSETVIRIHQDKKMRGIIKP